MKKAFTLLSAAGSSAARLQARLAELHLPGTTIYPSLSATAAALQAIEAQRLDWFSEPCRALVQRVAELERKTNHSATTTNAQPVRDRQPKRFPIICIEGLDGVGKTTVTRSLVERLNQFGATAAQRQQQPSFQAKLFNTPSADLEEARKAFRLQEEPIARAFYCAANYLIAEELEQWRCQQGPVVLDRWYASTLSMNIGMHVLRRVVERLTQLDNSGSGEPQRAQQDETPATILSVEGDRRLRVVLPAGTPSAAAVPSSSLSLDTFLPPRGSSVYAWSSDLRPCVDFGFLLDAPEAIRRGRIDKRQQGVFQEEQLLAEQEMLRDVVMAVLRRVRHAADASSSSSSSERPLLQLVNEVNYKATVNQILMYLEQKGHPSAQSSFSSSRKKNVGEGEDGPMTFEGIREVLYSDEEVKALAPF